MEARWDLAEMLFSDIDSEMPSGRFRDGRRAMVRVFYSYVPFDYSTIYSMVSVLYSVRDKNAR